MADHGGRTDKLGARRARAWVLGAIALLTAACSGSATGRDPSPSGVPAHLRIVMSDDWADTPPFIDAVRTFEQQHAGVRVQLDKLGAGDVMGSIDAMIRQGAPPDVVQGHAFAAAARGLAQPVDDLWRASGLQDAEYLPGAVEDVMWAGQHVGMPLDTNALVLFYNARHFADAGLPPPGTWKTFGDMERAAEALSRPDGSRRAIVLSNSTWRAYGWMSANGGEVVEVGPDGRPRFSLDATANVEALRFLRGLVDRGLAFHPSLGGFAEDPIALLRSGRASMYTSGSNDLVTLRKYGSAEDVGIATMPAGLGGTTEGSSMGGSSLFVPPGAVNRALAFDFMRHVTSDTFALRFAAEENRLPVRLRVYDDPFFKGREHQTVLSQLRSARVYKLEAFAVARHAFGDAVREALSGTKDPEAALRDAQAAARASGPS